jgi:rhodanese-related sulfurtransferase
MRTRNLIALAQFVFLATVATSAVSAPDTPATLPGIETVDKAYVAKAVEGKAAILLDVRAANGFSSGTIPGAINCTGIGQNPTEISETEVAKASEALTGCSALANVDKAREVVTFCKNVQCWISAKAALALSKRGFTNVKWFRAGLDSW